MAWRHVFFGPQWTMVCLAYTVVVFKKFNVPAGGLHLKSETIENAPWNQPIDIFMPF